MSRIGQKPVAIASGVEVTIGETEVTVKGSKGTLTQKIPDLVSVEKKENELVVTPANDSQDARANWGLLRSLLDNMIIGVSEGFSKKLELQGVGYRAAIQGNTLVMQLGFSHPVEYPFPEGIKIACATQTEIEVTGSDKQKVGQAAAEIRKWRKPEPYKGKGVRYVGEYVRRKEGKKK